MAKEPSAIILTFKGAKVFSAFTPDDLGISDGDELGNPSDNRFNLISIIEAYHIKDFEEFEAFRLKIIEQLDIENHLELDENLDISEITIKIKNMETTIKLEIHAVIPDHVFRILICFRILLFRNS